MHPKTSTHLSFFLLTLVAAAGLVLSLGSRPSARARAHSAEFQQLVGGLGLGPSANLSRCPFSFDPRLCPDCAQNSGPIPGGLNFCPHHACSIFYYPPLRREGQAGE